MTRFQEKYSAGIRQPKSPSASPVKRAPESPRLIRPTRIFPRRIPVTTARLMRKIGFVKTDINMRDPLSGPHTKQDEKTARIAKATRAVHYTIIVPVTNPELTPAAAI
jgi:hypothetical protein